MKFKRSFVFVILLLLFSMIFSLQSFAENDYFMFEIGSAEAKIGDTVSVDINIKNNPGIIGISCELQYDDSVLKLERVDDGGILGTEIQHQDVFKSPYKLLWANYTTDEATKESFGDDGVLCTLVFKVIGGNVGDELPLNLNLTNYSVMDFDLNDIQCNSNTGSIKLTGIKSGSSSLTLIIILASVVVILIGAFFILLKTNKLQINRDKSQNH